MSANGSDPLTQTLAESRFRGALPTGFKSTLVESDRLRQLGGVDAASLDNVVEDYGSNTLTERDIVRTEVQKVMTAFQTPERTLELPATGIEFARLQQFVAYHKQDNDFPSGTVKDEKRANTDDLVFSFAHPEVYEEITGNAQDTFQVEGLTSGSTVDLVGDSGLASTDPGTGNSITLDDDEALYFTGDYIDLSGGQSSISKIQWTDIDGESYGPDTGLFSSRLSSTHLFSGQGAWVKSTADLDAKVYEDGRAEIVPVAFYLAPGTKAPNLV
jgi:hypothetical protein